MKQINKTQKLKSKKEKDSREMIHMKKKLDEIENIIKKDLNKIKIKRNDFTQPIQRKIFKQASKIINIATPTLSEDSAEEIEPVEDPKEIETKDNFFNESTQQYLLDEERAFITIDLHVDPKPEPRNEIIPEKSWMGGYVKKNKRDRIKWESKVHQMEKRLLEKPMFDQAEELIDLAASDFSEWINSLSSDTKSNITKELIKELFPIGLEGEVTKALFVKPKQVNAIPDEVGKKWNLSELALQSNVLRIKKQNKKEDRQKPIKVAFGRTLPVDLQVPKRSMDLVDSDDLIPYFPEDLKSREVLFRGIHHLSSTKALIHYLIDNPEIEKPTFLRKNGYFETVKSELQQPKHIPLYEYFMNV